MRNQPPQNFTKIPLRKINNASLITDEMAKKNFPNCDASNMHFYIDVMCEFLRAQIGTITRDFVAKAKFSEELKRAELIQKRVKMQIKEFRELQKTKKRPAE